MTEFALRIDERSRLEMELISPVASVFCAAALILFAMSTTVPGQFAGRGFQIPWWGALIAIAVLALVGFLKAQRPSHYETNDDGVDIVTPLITYRIPYEEISEVVSVADRAPRSLFKAAGSGTLGRARSGLRNLMSRVKGEQIAKFGSNAENYTTSDTGGVQIQCKDGGSALLSPMELSAFLRELERKFAIKRLDVKVVREMSVQIGR